MPTTKDSAGMIGPAFGRFGVGGRRAVANSGGIGAGGWIFVSARSRGIFLGGLFFVWTNSAAVRSPGERALKSDLRLAPRVAGEPAPNSEWRLAPAFPRLDPLIEPFSIPSETAMSATTAAAAARARRRLFAAAFLRASPLPEISSSCTISPLTELVVGEFTPAVNLPLVSSN